MQAWWCSGHDPNTCPMVQAGSLGQMGMTQARQVAGPIGSRTVPCLSSGLERSSPWPYLGWMQVLEGTGGVLCVSSTCGICQAMQDH